MKTSIYQQHTENSAWLNKLSFYRDEIRIMQKRLQEVNSRNSSPALKKEVEHFQNQFIVQEKNIDDIRLRVRNGEKEILDIIRDNPVAADHKLASDHLAERDLVNGFEVSFNKLREEYKVFLSKAM